MASCQCNNTCSRSGKRGACPCKQNNRYCNYCRCGHLLPCTNLEDSTIDEDICFGPMKQHKDINTHRKRVHHLDVPEVPTKVRKQMTKPRPSKIPILQSTTSSTSPPPSSVRVSTKSTSVKSKLTSARPIPKPTSTKSKPASVIPTATSTSNTPAATSTRSPSTLSAGPMPPPNQIPTALGLLKIKKYIDDLDDTTKRELLAKLICQDKEIYKTVMESSHEPGDHAPEETSPSSGPSWCRCGNCRPMPTDIENRCCTKKKGQCVTNTDKFNRVGYKFNEDVLDAAGAYRNDLYVYDHHRNNRMFRHTAYRQFILMKHGVLRSGERKVVPSCTVLKIREFYPADNGHYTGFRPGRL